MKQFNFLNFFLRAQRCSVASVLFIKILVPCTLKVNSNHSTCWEANLFVGEDVAQFSMFNFSYTILNAAR